MSVFRAISEVSRQKLSDGVVARAIHGARITLAHVELEPNAVLPEHTHDAEQVGIMISGSMTFRIGDEKLEVRAGDTWCIPSNVPHDVVTGPDGGVVVETFSPPRTDWERFPLEAPAKTVWP